MKNIKVKINSATNFTTKELETLHRCATKLEVIFNHPDFKATLEGCYPFFGELSPWKDKKFEEIWAHIVSGKEELNGEVDYEIDIDITIFNPRWRNRSVVGYTYPTTAMTWINRKFFNWYGDKTICSNMIHEHLHKMGFDHDFKSTARRPYSVCYRANYACEKVYDQLFKLTDRL